MKPSPDEVRRLEKLIIRTMYDVSVPDATVLGYAHSRTPGNKESSGGKEPQRIKAAPVSVEPDPQPLPAEITVARDQVRLEEDSRSLWVGDRLDIVTPGQYAIVEVLLDEYDHGHYPVNHTRLVARAGDKVANRVSDIFGSDHPNKWMIRRLGKTLYSLSFLPPDQRPKPTKRRPDQ